MDDFLRATHNTVKDNDAKALSAKMGVPHVSLLQRSNPDDDAHHLTIEHLYGILLHTGDMRPLAALAADFGFQLVAKDRPPATDLATALLRWNAEGADVTRAVHDALADGRVSQLRRQQIEKEMAEARHAMDAIDAALRAV